LITLHERLGLGVSGNHFDVKKCPTKMLMHCSDKKRTKNEEKEILIFAGKSSVDKIV
jgi:hypothetical protein